MAVGLIGEDEAASWSVRRFILMQNIRHCEQCLAQEAPGDDLAWERYMLFAARRNLALLDAAMYGAGGQFAGASTGGGPNGVVGTMKDFALFRRVAESSPDPFLILDPRPGLRIVDANRAYLDATLIPDLSALAGEKMFDAFPDNPDDPEANGVSNLHRSLLSATQLGLPHRMPVQRYDIEVAGEGFVERYWSPINTPIFDEHGRLKFILHHVEDVTGSVLSERRVSPSPRASAFG